MNWGKGLALALASFAALMAWFIVKASQEPEPLVTEQYYEQELKYQERIDDIARARTIGPVRMDVTRGTVRILFPEEVHGRSISGDLLLQRPNDPSKDRRVMVRPDAKGDFGTDGMQLVPGRYNAQLEWRADGVTYYTEERIVVP